MKHWTSFFIVPVLAVAGCSTAPEASAPLEGDWSLVSDASHIAFVSIKADNVGEAHRFKTASGGVDAKGTASVAIDLSSVDTKVDIRDERMRDILFQVGQFPNAIVGTQIDPAVIKTLAIGEQKQVNAPLSLDLHGVAASLDAMLMVTRISDDRVLVETPAPIIVDATQFGLGERLEQLREIAGLPSITPVVPVTASLIFERGTAAQ